MESVALLEFEAVPRRISYLLRVYIVTGFSDEVASIDFTHEGKRMRLPFIISPSYIEGIVSTFRKVQDCTEEETRKSTIEEWEYNVSCMKRIRGMSPYRFHDGWIAFFTNYSKAKDWIQCFEEAISMKLSLSNS